MVMFGIVLLSYFLVTGGLIYDVIVEPPSVGSTTDEYGNSKPEAFMQVCVSVCLSVCAFKPLPCFSIVSMDSTSWRGSRLAFYSLWEPLVSLFWSAAIARG